jgi:hypothetical protein
MSLRLFEDGDALPGKDAFAKRKLKTVVGKYIVSVLLTAPTNSRRNLLKWADHGTRRS